MQIIVVTLGVFLGLHLYNLSVTPSFESKDHQERRENREAIDKHMREWDKANGFGNST